MKRILILMSALFCILLCACANHSESIGIIGGADGPTQIVVSNKGESKVYKQISPDEAKKIMDSDEDIVILDTREREEYDEGHIPGAILLPYTEVYEKAEKVLSDKDKTILVYCRSGRRSKIAAQALADLGYTNVKEFGGIIDWKYEIEK